MTGWDKTAEKVPEGEVNLPEKVDGYTITAIGSSMFYKNQDIEAVIIPSTVQKIEASAFCGCQNLTQIILPEGVEEIGKNAFESCGIETLVLPKSMRQVGGQAFRDSAVTNVIVKGTTTFDVQTFLDCKRLQTAKFEGNVAEISGWMFFGCTQ